MKTLAQTRSDARKKGSNLFKWSREARPDPILFCGSEEGGFVITKDMLELAPFANIFATGPEDTLKNRHCFYCKVCKRNISMKSRSLYEIIRQFQREQLLSAGQRFCARYHPTKLRGSDGRKLKGSKLEAGRDLLVLLDVRDLVHKRRFYYDVTEEKPFTFTNKSAPVPMQMELLTSFLRGRGQLWTFGEYSIQVSVLIGHSASTADFR